MSGQVKDDSEALTRRRFLRQTAGGAACVGAACLAGCPQPADPINQAKVTAIRNFMASEVSKGTIPGIGVVATHKGTVFLNEFIGQHCGMLTIGTPFSASILNTLFSTSKGVTATVAARVYEAGLISFDSTAKTYIPEFTGGGKDAITLRQLLSHAAGLDHVGLAAVSTAALWNEALATVCAAETSWTPGSKTAYHATSAAFVAAEAIRRVTGMASWQETCRTWLFDPLGASSLTFDAPAANNLVSLTPWPDVAPGEFRPEWFPFLGHPGAGLYGTPADLLKVILLMLNGGLYNGTRLLRKTTVEEMLTPQYANEIAAAQAAGNAPVHDEWGLGWLLMGDSSVGWGAWWFGGQVPANTFGHLGYRTVLAYADPTRELAACISQTDEAESDTEDWRVRTTITEMLSEAINV